MKRSIFSALVLSGLIANAQDYKGRVGINTETPKASLEIRKHTGIPSQNAQGLLLPQFTTSERTAFTDNAEISTLIYNTDKKCIEMYLGVVNGAKTWSCLQDAQSAEQQQQQGRPSVVPNGFEGTYAQGVPMNSANKVKFKLTNNSLSTIGPINFSSAVTITNGTANITATGVNNSNITINAGNYADLEYTLNGVPTSGTLTADFSAMGLTSTQNINVIMGDARFPSSNTTRYIASLAHSSARLQGTINNTKKIIIKIPYTDGIGSYPAYENTQQTSPGEGNDVNNLTLSIPQGTFNGSTGTLTATITVDGDGEYLVKQMTPGSQYTIATFPVIINGASTTITLKGIGGVLDKYYGDGVHDFVYTPILIGDEVWLNNNLGAEYANVHSEYFSPMTQAENQNDWKAFGSLFQFGRDADGHEIIKRSNSDTRGTYNGPILNSATDTKTPNNDTYYYFNQGESNYWYNKPNEYGTLWGYGQPNDPCPEGYFVPSKRHVTKLTSGGNASQYTTMLKLSAPVKRSSNGLWSSGRMYKEMWLNDTGYVNYNYFGGITRTRHVGIIAEQLNEYQLNHTTDTPYEGAENGTFLTSGNPVRCKKY